MAKKETPARYVEHKGQMSEVFDTPEGGVTAKVVGNDIYSIWVDAPDIEELAVKYGWVLDNVVNK